MMDDHHRLLKHEGPDMKDHHKTQKGAFVAGAWFDKLIRKSVIAADKTTLMINEHMCSKKCPCDENMIPDSHDDHGAEGSLHYHNMSESVWNHWGRTINDRDTYNPIVWLNDESQPTVASFSDCLDGWIAKKDYDQSIDLTEIFGIDYDYGPQFEADESFDPN